MSPLDRQAVNNFVNTEIVYFHEKRLGRLEAINLNEVLKKKNPYLFKAKHITNAGGLISSILGAFLSSSEEKLFGDFRAGRIGRGGHCTVSVNRFLWGKAARRGLPAE